jgi:hypothetical protein
MCAARWRHSPHPDTRCVLLLLGAKLKKDGTKAKSTSFSALHPAVMAQMPIAQQQRFKFMATHRGAVDWDVLASVSRLAGTGNVPFQDLSNALKEFRANYVLGAQQRYLDHQLKIDRNKRKQPSIPDLLAARSTPTCLRASCLWIVVEIAATLSDAC